MSNWIKDENGNRCSVQDFGSKERAQKALDSLENCKNCINCRDCRDCRDCIDCIDCSNCRSCRDCRDCRSCRDCRDCRDCSYCRSCIDCIDCRDCIDCSYCSNCRSCRSCRDCIDCIGEVRDFKAPEVPKIKNIHQSVYVAASKEGALEMCTWHKNGFCGTTHCRAGWVNHLAGEKGKALEDYYGPDMAALKIYRASSDIEVNITTFFESNEISLADMKEKADLEKSNAQ